jgi:hypothetical protein
MLLQVIIVGVSVFVQSVAGQCGTTVRECSCDFNPEIVSCPDAILSQIPKFLLPTPFKVFVLHGNYIWTLDDEQLDRIGDSARLLDLRFQLYASCVKDITTKSTGILILGLCPPKVRLNKLYEDVMKKIYSHVSKSGNCY